MLKGAFSSSHIIGKIISVTIMGYEQLLLLLLNFSFNTFDDDDVDYSNDGHLQHNRYAFLSF